MSSPSDVQLVRRIRDGLLLLNDRRRHGQVPPDPQVTAMADALTSLIAATDIRNWAAAQHEATIDVAEAAQKLRRTTRHVRHLCATGQLRAIQPGGPGTPWRIAERDLERTRTA